MSSIEEKRLMGLKMVAGSFYIPKENKNRPQGEDAHFICHEKQTIGVADGVGGWNSRGVDAGEYARQLMNNAVTALHGEPDVDPREVLQNAYTSTNVEGSSTACIITLKGEYLHYVNVGDSGFMVFRDNSLVYRSPVQQYRFNCPYQLGTSRGSPSLSYEGRFKVKADDIVVVGTDGLFDNIKADEISDMLGDREERFWPDKLAWDIADVAYFNSVDKKYDSPFSIAAGLAGFEHVGGKYDDITVVVAEIDSIDTSG